ncbi:restriction endonuclease [Amycolatopsis thermoflava]|uniref:restriction endonuclease n=1 Tax=Amycolatopsis thermoflava TaxID=84480 RepID=UPI001E2EF6C2|nr:restriction endonuclease [Amycolatopsis thermoflava]
MRREAEREAREAERQRKAREKAEREAYQLARLTEAAAKTKAVEDRVAELDTLVSSALARPAGPLDFNRFKRRPGTRRLQLGADAEPAPRPVWEQFAPRPPRAIGLLFGGARRYAELESSARQRFAAALRDYDAAEVARQRRVTEKRREHAERVAAEEARVHAQHAEIDELAGRVRSGDRHAVSWYFQQVLDSVPEPSGLPTERRAGYVPESTLLAVEWRLPGVDAVPVERAFRYVKNRDAIDAVPRSSSEIRSTYQRLVAQIALSALRSVFAADPAELVNTVAFIGVVEAVDPATGQQVRPCLLTLRATREHFEELVLEQLDPVACIRKHFAADVSPHPEELVPVQPVMTFDMADPRIIEPVDVLSEIDRRPNLIEYKPKEFEHFIQNLFTRMGLDTQVFRADGDGGVDCVAYDPTPITGGKFVVQAKLYTKTVQPAAVRDLYGTMQHEGATKGILITTSGYGPSSHEFANGKPLQLIDGSGLLALCHQYGIAARILMPPKGDGGSRAAR